MEIYLEGLDCASCAEKIRAASEKLKGVEKAEINFFAKKMSVTLSEGLNEKNTFKSITEIVRSLEPDVRVYIQDKTFKPDKTGEDEKLEAYSKIMEIARLVITMILFILGMILRNELKGLWLFISAYFIIGFDVLKKAGRNILKGKPFDECFLMTVATLGAFFVGEYPEGVAVMFLYQLGEMFQGYAVKRSRKSISDLMDIRPDYANVRRDDGIIKLSPEQVSIGEIITVKAGEKIPLDAEVISGESSIDTASLTGESVPRHVGTGDIILSGCVNLNGYLEARVLKSFGESAVSKILELVENSAVKKAKTESFITRFAKIYTPCVVIAAVLLAAVPMLLEGGFSSIWLYRALSFLVVSCPCALVISIPLSFFGGIGGASKRGVLVKGGNCLEALSECKTVIFDKTGTLTTGSFEVTKISPVNINENELITLAAYAEKNSNHPAALAVMKKFGGKVPEDIKYTETAGMGVKAETADGKTILAGNIRLMEKEGIQNITVGDKITGTAVYVAVNNVYVGYIQISDAVKPDAADTVSWLKQSGINTVMLTGDRRESAQITAKHLGIDDYKAELLPDGKAAALENIMDSNKGGKIAFVGDGINDAPVLMRADVGIAMGGLGSDAAIEAADVVIMTDEPSRIIDAIKISRKTRAIVKQNIIFSLGVKALVLILSALGITTMWAAVFADVGVSLIAVFNAMRAGKIR